MTGWDISTIFRACRFHTKEVNCSLWSFRNWVNVTKGPHTARQTPSLIFQNIETQIVFIGIFNCKVNAQHLLIIQGPKVNLSSWHITLAPSAQVILTLCLPGHTLRFSAFCCINVGHCPHLSIKMLLIVNENNRDLNIWAIITCMYWWGSTCWT